MKTVKILEYCDGMFVLINSKIISWYCVIIPHCDPPVNIETLDYNSFETRTQDCVEQIIWIGNSLTVLWIIFASLDEGDDYDLRLHDDGPASSSKYYLNRSDPPWTKLSNQQLLLFLSAQHSQWYPRTQHEIARIFNTSFSGARCAPSNLGRIVFHLLFTNQKYHWDNIK